MKKRRFLLLTLLLFVASTSLLADQCVVVEMTDGTKTEYLLADAPRINYSGTAVTIVTNQTSVELQVDEVRKVYVATSSTSEIETSKACQPVRIAVTSNGLYFAGLEANAVVTATTANGQVVANGRATVDGKLSLNFTQKGIIVVKTSNRNFKLIRK